jgi:hypothetical protein
MHRVHTNTLFHSSMIIESVSSEKKKNSVQVGDDIAAFLEE